MKKHNPDLKLPILKNRLPEPRSLSMDDYYRFVIDNIRNMPDAARKSADYSNKTKEIKTRFIL